MTRPIALFILIALAFTAGCVRTVPRPPATVPAPVAAAPTTPKPTAAVAQEKWKSLFDGKSLDGWKSANFGGEGDVEVKDGAIVMQRGNDMTGATYARDDFPKLDYEVTLEGKKLQGNDFFCTTTFPVADSHCSLVVGGWGGTVVGLSSLDGRDASENETNSQHTFNADRWYKVRIRVTKDRIQAWIDDQRVVNANTAGKTISIRGECELSQPFGFATWRTTGAVRNVRVRPLSAEEIAAK